MFLLRRFSEESAHNILAGGIIQRIACFRTQQEAFRRALEQDGDYEVCQVRPENLEETDTPETVLAGAHNLVYFASVRQVCVRHGRAQLPEWDKLLWDEVSRLEGHDAKSDWLV